jgi:hypothetical protein
MIGLPPPLYPFCAGKPKGCLLKGLSPLWGLESPGEDSSGRGGLALQAGGLA